MSFDAIVWALRQRAGGSAEKLVLIALADLVRRPAMKAYASAPTIANTTELNQKTVRRVLQRLQDRGLIRRLDERVGLGGAPVFVLSLEAGSLPKNGWTPGHEVSPNLGGLPEGSQNRSLPKLGPKSGHCVPEVSPNLGTNPVEPVEPVKRERASKSRTRKCPEDFFVTEAMRVWAAQNAPGVDVDRATASFRDWEFKSSKSDWLATWRIWLRKEKPGAQSGRQAVDLRAVEFGTTP